MVFFLGRWNGRWFLRRNHCSQWFSEGFLQFNHCCQLFFQAWTIGINGFSMVFDHRTIAIESMVLQSTIGDDGFSMVNEKKRQWFSKIAIYDKKLLLEFKLPTQIEIAQSYQDHHALLPYAMWTYICQNWDLNSSKWGLKLHLKSSWLEIWHLYGQARAEKLAKVYINPRTLSCFGQSFTSLVQFPCSMTERVQNF